MANRIVKVIIKKRNTNSSCGGIVLNIDANTAIAKLFTESKDTLLSKIIQSYIDDNKTLPDILEYEAPTNTTLQHDIITLYCQIIQTNITAILDERKKNSDSIENDNDSVGDGDSDSVGVDDSDSGGVDDSDGASDIVNRQIIDLRNTLQCKYLEDAIQKLDTDKKIILKGPTGFGKTVINYQIINHYAEKITLILTPRRLLNIQTQEDKYKKFLTGNYKFYNYSPDTIQTKHRYQRLKKFIDSHTNMTQHKIIVLACYASCKTLFTNLERDNVKIGLIICDEAHVISCWSNLDKPFHNTFFKQNQQPWIFDKYVFTTATPTQDMCNATILFGTVIEHIQIYELINSRILCDFETIVKHINYETQHLDMAYFIMQIMNDYKKRKCIIYVNTQLNAINMYAHIKVKYPNYPVYIYISKHLKQATFGNDSAVIFSKDDTNINHYRDNTKPSIIITCNKISYGYDNVDIDLICFGDPRQSDTEIRQIIGRGLRNDLVKYPNKLLHVVLPITEKCLLEEANDLQDVDNIDNVDDANSSDYIKIKNFIQFIINECGKDIIDGRIVSSNDADGNSGDVDMQCKKTGKTYIGDKIPHEICRELCTTLYSKYSKFLGYLRLKGIFDETSYNTARATEGEPDWMPVLGDIRKRFKKFCFLDIGAKENARYYKSWEECNVAYSKALQQVAVNGGYYSIIKLRAKKTEDKINMQIYEMDNKIPKCNELYYYNKV